MSHHFPQLTAKTEYRRLYILGRFGIQIILERGNGIVVDLTPGIAVSSNNASVLAIGFQWVCGQVNFAILRQSYIDMEKFRRQRIQETAERLKITYKQSALRWGWS